MESLTSHHSRTLLVCNVSILLFSILIVTKDSPARGRVTYAGTTYDGAIDTTMKQEGKEMTTRMTMKGKYLGPCPK